MSQGVLSNPARWRAFADAVALALGINVWISIVVLPGLFVGSWRESTDIVVASLPLAALALGLWRRAEIVLLLVFPSTLMIPVALSPEIVGSHVYGPIRFAIVAVGLVAYLFGVSFFSSFYEPPPPHGVRPLASSQEPVPQRWQRRLRLYRALVALSVVFPATMIYTVNFDRSNQAFLLQMYPGRVAQMATVINLAMIAAWVLLYSYAFLGVLRPHRTGDRVLVTDLARIRASARRGKPQPIFYVGVACALGFMLLLLFGRYF
jgi:hypothetical protein